MTSARALTILALMLVPIAGAYPRPAVVADAETLPVCRTARPPVRAALTQAGYWHVQGAHVSFLTGPTGGARD